MELGRRKRDPLPVVCLVAFVSGFASLVYQIHWQRELTLIIGVSHYATTVVLLTFFLGFGLGAWLMHEKLNPDRNPFLWMMIVEGITGLYGLLSPWIFDLIGFASGLVLRADHGGLLRTLEAGSFAVAGLLLPTICMGATLPIFYAAAIESLKTKSTRIALVSGTNTIGALCGSVVMTFLWMGSMSSSRQIVVAALLNGLGFLLSIVLWRSGLPAKPAEESESAANPLPLDRRLMWSYFLTGAAALGLELVWNRMVYLSLDHTIYTFALTLTVYLWSFSLGLFVSAPVMRRFPPTPNRQAAILALSLASTIAGFQLYRYGVHAKDLANQFGYAGAALLVTMGFVFIPSFLMGVASPQLLHLLTHRLSSLGKETSRLLLFNNVGSVAAILIAGFVLVPRFGIQAGALFGLSLLAAAVLVLVDLQRFAKPARQALIGLGGLGTLAILWLSCRALNDGHLVRYYKNPALVLEDESGIWGLDVDPLQVTLKLNGYYENHLPLPPNGTIQGDFLIPAMVQPEIRSVFMVGLGLGVGAYEMLRLPEIQRFEAAEISSGSRNLAFSVWRQYGGGFFQDPRFHSRLEDGRVLLTYSQKRYDTVIAGTNRSFYAGSTHIYSEEYWRMVRERLTDRGMLLQWLPMYSLESALSILRTFSAVFPDTLVLRYKEYYYLLGFKNPDVNNIQNAVTTAYSQRGDILRTTDLPLPELFMARLYTPRHDSLKDAAPINSDRFPFVEYSFRWSEGGDELTTAEKIRQEFLEPYLSKH